MAFTRIDLADKAPLGLPAAKPPASHIYQQLGRQGMLLAAILLLHTAPVLLLMLERMQARPTRDIPEVAAMRLLPPVAADPTPTILLTLPTPLLPKAVQMALPTQPVVTFPADHPEWSTMTVRTVSMQATVASVSSSPHSAAHCAYFAGVAPGCDERRAAAPPAPPPLSVIESTQRGLRSELRALLGAKEFGKLVLLIRVNADGKAVEVRDVQHRFDAETMRRIDSILLARKLYSIGTSLGTSEWREWRIDLD